MPSIGSGLSVLHYGYEEHRCRCCPYGYHIDVDFVPFSKKMLSGDSEALERLQALKDKCRSERRSMDTLLGVPLPLPNFAARQQDGGESFQSSVSENTWISQLKSVREIEIIHRRTTLPDTSLSSSRYEDILGNGLTEAVTDFEEALSRTRPEARTLSYSIPASKKFHTFPRIKPVAKDYQQDTTSIGLMSSSNCLSNKGSTTSTSASTVIMKEASVPLVKDTRVQESNTSLHSNTDSIYSQSFQLNGLKRDGHNDKRIDYLEEQVKLIPELEVKLTLLKEEKRQLMKLLDNEKQKSAKLEEQVNTIKLASKNESRTPILSPVAPPRRKTRDASVGRTILTRDVGITHTMPRTRSVGVGGNTDLLTQVLERSSSRPDSSSPTGSISTTLRRRVRNFDIGIQVKEHDFKGGPALNLLQIVEKVDCGVQTASVDEVDKSLVKPRVVTKNSGMLAKPRTGDTGCTVKPTCKDVGISTVDKTKDSKPSTRTVGVMAQITDPAPAVPERLPFKKLSKSFGVNTEKQVQKTTGTNTVAEKDTVVAEEPPVPRLSVSLESLRFKTPDRVVERTRTPTPVEKTRTPDRVVERTRTPTPVEKARTPDRVVERTRTPTPVLIEEKSERSATPPIPIPSPETKISKIPRLASSPTSPKLPMRPRIGSPVEEREQPEDSSTSLASGPPSATRSPPPGPPSGIPVVSGLRRPVFQRSDTFTKEIHFPISRYPPCQLEPLEEEDKERPSTSGSFVSLQEPREKAVPTKEMQGALKVLNDALLRGRTTQQVTSAISIILHEWFRVAGTKTANPLDVEDYLDFFESYSPQLLRYIVNMPDGNGNTAMHYAVSHGNFDVVSILLDSKVCDPNKANKAGYTSVMLVSLAKILTETHRQVVRRLFSLGDVNIKAAQHGQTALMLGASHGRLDTVKLLIEAGADVNIQDEDGSTALMCAAEHGHGDIVKYLLAQADCDPNITDNDSSTALSVAMEAGHKDIGVMLYAHMHFLKGPTPTSSTSMLTKRSRSTTPSSHNSESPASSSHTSPLLAKKHLHPSAKSSRE